MPLLSSIIEVIAIGIHVIVSAGFLVGFIRIARQKHAVQLKLRRISGNPEPLPPPLAIRISDFLHHKVQAATQVSSFFIKKLIEGAKSPSTTPLPGEDTYKRTAY